MKIEKPAPPIRDPEEKRGAVKDDSDSGGTTGISAARAANDMDIAMTAKGGDGLNGASKAKALVPRSGEVEVEDVEVPGVVYGVEKAKETGCVTVGAGEEVGQGRGRRRGGDWERIGSGWRGRRGGGEGEGEEEEDSGEKEEDRAVEVETGVLRRKVVLGGGDRLHYLAGALCFAASLFFFRSVFEDKHLTNRPSIK